MHDRHIHGLLVLCLNALNFSSQTGQLIRIKAVLVDVGGEVGRRDVLRLSLLGGAPWLRVYYR